MSPQVLPQNKPYYIFESLQHLHNRLICAFTLRGSGNMSLFYGETQHALANRDKFLKDIGITYRDLVCAKQVHGTKVQIASFEDKGKGALTYDDAIADTDAFITCERNLPLAVFTADCLSIFLYDPQTPSIGLIHAGWRSSKENIVAKTIVLMKDKFHARPEAMYACFGASIRVCCYEVGSEFRDYFTRGLLPKGDRYYLDLVKINTEQIVDAGLSDKNIFDSRICTSCQIKEYFSYRKEGRSCGRMMSVIMLR